MLGYAITLWGAAAFVLVVHAIINPLISRRQSHNTRYLRDYYGLPDDSPPEVLSQTGKYHAWRKEHQFMPWGLLRTMVPAAIPVLLTWVTLDTVLDASNLVIAIVLVTITFIIVRLFQTMSHIQDAEVRKQLDTMNLDKKLVTRLETSHPPSRATRRI